MCVELYTCKVWFFVYITKPAPGCGDSTRILGHQPMAQTRRSSWRPHLSDIYNLQVCDLFKDIYYAHAHYGCWHLPLRSAAILRTYCPYTVAEREDKRRCFVESARFRKFTIQFAQLHIPPALPAVACQCNIAAYSFPPVVTTNNAMLSLPTEKPYRDLRT